MLLKKVYILMMHSLTASENPALQFWSHLVFKDFLVTLLGSGMSASGSLGLTIVGQEAKEKSLH